ncbi:hypothetical protein VTJ49DRAFT_6821 [Mycothermus thermophilus]|uniref:Uncharacterized protein n=1 Tax=Humicola insolens TaxID=85995 RepID=A0ABR3V0R6_HUMIN
MQLPSVINTALTASRGIAGIGLVPPASVKDNTGNIPGWDAMKQINIDIPSNIREAASNAGKYAREKVADGANWAKDNTGNIPSLDAMKRINIDIPSNIRDAASNAGKYAREKVADGVDWAKENPGSAALGVAAVGGLAVVAAPAIVSSPMLAAAGFGPSGPVAGSLAAVAQSSIGNVAAGSMYATLQSAAMGGYGVAQVAGVVQSAGACIAAVAGAGAVMAQNKEEENKERR